MTAIDPAAGPSTSAQVWRERLAGLAQTYGAAVVLVVLLVVGSIAFPAFPTASNLANIATQSSFLLIVGVGMTFVILTGGIDLSVGSQYALGGVLAAYGSAWGLGGGLLLPLVVCVVIGLVQGAIVAYGGLAPFIVTLAGLLGVRGLVLALTGGGSSTPLVTDPALSALGQGGVAGLRWPVFIALAAVLVGSVLLLRSRGGQAVLAVGGSESASVLMGLPVARVKLTVYTVSGVCAGLAGALTAAYTSSGVPTVGVGLELSAISAVVIGGTLLVGGRGNLVGTTAGVLLLTVIQNLINQVGSLTSSVQAVVSGGFLAVVVILQTVLARTQRL
ncbi:ABC transporter permease [Galbitalea sp. SE-J8]|uniref:ABC transporter permease n=1 Tax=Galbitalea sp. SE-J8 TaxID=3054952 RepID=UPI00259C6B8E|nr:ABC transporter permease [Galbitalea sp. SE-J8]MDM4763059.1 ABC transporter permease [Galbitalea sp. SE-J8]